MTNNFTALGLLKLVHIQQFFKCIIDKHMITRLMSSNHVYIIMINMNYCKYIRVHEHFCSNLDIPFLLKFTTEFLINR